MPLHIPESHPEAPDQIDEETLLQSDRDRFIEAIFIKYQTRIFRICRKILRDDDAAEEATSRTFLKMCQKLDLFTPGRAPFYVWLVRIARNTAIDMIRARAREQKILIPEEHDEENIHAGPSVAPAQEILVLHRDARRRLVKFTESIDDLSSRQLEVLLALFDAEPGQQQQDVAMQIGMNAQTFRATLHRARNILQAHLGPRNGKIGF